jgi:hypothetical protein
VGVVPAIGGQAESVIGEDQQRPCRIQARHQLAQGGGELGPRQREQLDKRDGLVVDERVDDVDLLERVLHAGCEDGTIAPVRRRRLAHLRKLRSAHLPFAEGLGQQRLHRGDERQPQAIHQHPLRIEIRPQAIRECRKRV